MPDTNISIPQQEGQADASGGKAIADYNPDVDYKPEGNILKLKQNKRKTLMQNMQTWSYLEMGHCVTGQ